jgi:hypothetical protein
MRKFLIAAAAVAALFTGSFASTSARADMWGGEIKQGNQCWKGSTYLGGAGWGYWAPCEKPVVMHRHHKKKMKG